MNEFVSIDCASIASEHLCCIIRKKTVHNGIEAKRRWLSERIKEGHVFRKLNADGRCFIEYAPLEKAWTPVVGDNFFYIYCLWVDGAFKGKGYGKSLMEYCIADAKEKGKSGVCMLGSKKQKNWLSNQDFAKKFGFHVVDSTDCGYELLALSFDGTYPSFTARARSERIDNSDLTVYYDYQCPFIYQKIQELKLYCEKNGISADFICIDTLQKAKDLPCVFNNWGAFYQGRFISVNLLDVFSLQKMLEKKR